MSETASATGQQASARPHPLSAVVLAGGLNFEREVSLSSGTQVVEELTPHPFQVVLPAVAVDAIAVEPVGAHPSYADGYYDRDDVFYEAWDPIGRDRETFRSWMEEHVLGTQDFGGYLGSVRGEGMVAK